ncbi:phage late control D family protein [Bernardetia sp.]|uniref:phage late control D family protein n=1 Tax=Bernardetia sp. TaxID=1937974 RepID=UPI0025C660A3|nr:contractile injection system protein, VgrG/Pvc8 family [Bernardetia sp.]
MSGVVGSPFYKIIIAPTGEDITPLVDSFSYEDTIEKDDLLRISVSLKNVFELDEDWLVAGEKLRFMFGYIGGLQTEERVAKISDISSSYGEVIKVRIDAVDVGQFMKEEFSNKIHKDKTLSELVEEMADTYSYKTDVIQTKKKYPYLPQAQKSDFDFLMQLAKRENLVFRVSGDTLILEKRNLLKEAVKTYTWGKDIISFVPKVKYTKQDTSSQKITSYSINPQTNEIQKSEAKSENKEKEKLGEYNIKVDANGNAKKVFPKKKAESEKSEDGKLVQGSTDKSQNDGLVNTLQEDKSLAGVTAKLVVEGNPLLKANDILTIAGVAKKHEGNWKVMSAKHDVSAGSYYKTTCELKKNATSKSVTNVQPDKASSKRQQVNTTQGSTAVNEAQSKVLVFDANGKEVKNG